MKPILSPTLALTCMLSLNAFADFELGFSYYQNKEFAKAFKEFTYSASIGDKDAQRNIGVMYFRGEGVDKSPALAYAWLKLANTPETPENAKVFAAISKKITSQEQAQGELELAKLKPFSDDVINEKLSPETIDALTAPEPKLLKSVKPIYPRIAVQAGDIGVLEFSYTISKDGSTRDFVPLHNEPRLVEAALEALRQYVYQPAQAQGRAINYYDYRFRFKYMIHGTTLKADEIKKALKEQREKANQGDAGNMLLFGLQNELYQNYLRGMEDKNLKTIEFDNPNAWFFKSAAKGNANAAFILGTNQLRGAQCKQNTSAGAAWLERSASLGSVDAQFLLGNFYYDGDLTSRDEEKGVYWLQKASRAGNANATIKLARIYSSSKSEHWFKPQDAQLAFNQVKDTHLDQLSYFEVKASVAAANGDFKTAVSAQEKAMDLATKYKITLPAHQLALGNYKQNQPWREL